MTGPDKIWYALIPVLWLAFSFCDNTAREKINTGPELSEGAYLNHHDSAKYVGIHTCRQCHQDIYNTFIETGMGKSFDQASEKKSSADFSLPGVYDRFLDLHYRALWRHDSLFVHEYRVSERDTTYQRFEQVNYIIGSGQHTNSHLQNTRGYLNQMPLTWYSQKKRWDLPPGFENGLNTRFTRKIGIECMTCHNAYPGFVKGSENKFSHLPSGIDCERCHGPGSIHVAQRSTGSRVDTSRYIDYSIVNPRKLPVDLQFDICQRCHLQGNAILKEGSSFYSFKPGQKLSDHFTVFLPKYSNSDEDFIMASHADRLRQSPCFISSHQANEDKNRKPGPAPMTCITCHNPHVSVKTTNPNVFNEACLKCHGDLAAAGSTLVPAHRRMKQWDNCTGCHMPLSGASDIPHVSVHDHYIRKPVARAEVSKIRQFVGLYAINEKSPSALTRVMGYLNQYEKFEQEPLYLDSARNILKTRMNDPQFFHAAIQLSFIKRDFKGIISLAGIRGEQKLLENILTKQTYDNRDAWTAYRIAEAYHALGDAGRSRPWFERAAQLAPYNLDFRNKLGSVLVSLGALQQAKKEFLFIMQEHPGYVAAYTNLGYLAMLEGYPAEALRFYRNGLKLDPDNESLLLNLAAYYLQAGSKKPAQETLNRILKVNPANAGAREALRRLNS